MLTRPFILAAAVALLFASAVRADDAAVAKEPPVKPSKASIAADANNQFFATVYARLKARDDGKGNLFFSPFSLSSALTMTSNGANGPTADEMHKVLQITSPAGVNQGYADIGLEYWGDVDAARPYTLTIANSLWIQKGEPCLPGFTDLMQRDFRAEFKPLDFAHDPEPSRVEINKWVETKTHDKIKDLIAPGVIVPQTKLVLANAMYFKGTWEEQFTKGRTTNDEFETMKGEVVKTPTMHLQKNLKYTADGKCQALELDYKGRLSMLILLPSAPPTDVIENRPVQGALPRVKMGKFEDNLSADYIARIRGKLTPVMIQLSLPKWKATIATDMTGTLQDLGMKLALSPDADFSLIDGKKDLFISAVVHKAFVDVDENGTEAAAATAIVMRAGAMMRQTTPTEFKADHAFVYFILDRPTGAILFAGRVADPSKQE